MALDDVRLRSKSRQRRLVQQTVLIVTTHYLSERLTAQSHHTAARF